MCTKYLPTWGISTCTDFSAEDPTIEASLQSPSGHQSDLIDCNSPDSVIFKTFWDKLSRCAEPRRHEVAIFQE